MGYGQAPEELRAEIIALLSSIECYDELVATGMLKEWPNTMRKEKMIKLSIVNMARTGLRADTAQQITGAHAQANTIIINKGAIELRSEPIKIKDVSYTILDVHVIDNVKEVIFCYVKKIMLKVSNVYIFLVYRFILFLFLR